MWQISALAGGQCCCYDGEGGIWYRERSEFGKKLKNFCLAFQCIPSAYHRSQSRWGFFVVEWVTS